MTKTASLAKNTVLVAISKVSAQLIVFLMLPLYTAVLRAEEYGAVDLIITYASLFAPLIMLNMEMAVFRHLIDARDDGEARRRIITNTFEIIGISSVLAALAFFVVNIFAPLPMAGAMAFYFFSSSLGGVIVQVARGLGNTKAFAIVSIAQGVLGVGLNILFLVGLHMGPVGMLLGLALGTLLPALVLAFLIKLSRDIRRSSRDRATKKELIAYSLPLVPNSISWWVFNVSDRTIVSLVIGMAANGIYAVSNKFSAVLNGLWGVFYLSWSESAAINIGSANRDRFFSQIANVSLRVFGALTILGTAITPIAFPFLATAEYAGALFYVPVLMLAAFFNIIVGFYSAIYIAKKLTRQVMNTSVIAAVINLVVNLALIWFVGLWAAAISTAVAYGAMAVYRHYDMKKYVKITYEKGLFVKIFGLFAVVCGLYYLDNFWASVVGLAVAVVASIFLNYSLLKKMFVAGRRLTSGYTRSH